MSESTDPESDPKDTPSAEPAGDSSSNSEKDPAAEARKLADQAVNTFKGFDLESKVYVVGLAVAFLCSLIFRVHTMPDVPAEVRGLVEAMAGSMPSYTMANVPTWGILAILAAGAGLGIFIWSTVQKRKDSWIPKGLAISAGICALCFLIAIRGHFSGGSLLGWWLPFAGATAASVVSVRRLMNPSTT